MNDRGVQFVFSYVSDNSLAFDVLVFGRSVGSVYLTVADFERLLDEGFPITAFPKEEAA